MEKVTVEVFYSDTCPNCPPQKDLAKQFQDQEDVKVRLTNVSANNGRAKNHGVRAVPTTVVDGPALDQKTGFRGVMAEEKLETAIEVAKGEKNQDALENPGLLDALKNVIS
ncbi:MAG: thioredoxin family protein [Candidatus Nanohaloarchaea archaeon]